MRGEAVPQRMNADPLGDAGTPGCQANDPMQLARTRMLTAVTGKQPGLTGTHPALRRFSPPARLARCGALRRFYPQRLKVSLLRNGFGNGWRMAMATSLQDKWYSF